MHRDIKGDNICISGRQACIIDFGMARSLIVDGPENDGDEMKLHHMQNGVAEDSDFGDKDEEKSDDDDDDDTVPNFFSRTRTVTASRSNAQYSAPEVLLTCGHYNSKVDIWALGCLLSEMLYCCDSAQLLANKPKSTSFLLRFLFRDEKKSNLPLIFRYAVTSAGDLEDLGQEGHRQFSKRFWQSMVDRGFIDEGELQAAYAQLGPPYSTPKDTAFPWSDLSSKFTTPAALPSNEIPIFEQLRSVMLRMLSFDPDQRCTAAEALQLLSISDYVPERVSDHLLEEFRNLQQMLDDSKKLSTFGIASHHAKCLAFIKHVDSDNPLGPSPISLLL
jgi:serine/threonine protein kinase